MEHGIIMWVEKALESGSLPVEWWIGLPSWVLQDGNYTDFETGQQRQFALEFHYDRTTRLVPAQVSLARRCRFAGATTKYEVTGYLQSDAGTPRTGLFVLDFGLLAYTKWIVLDDLEPPRAGAWLHGGISLQVDPFDYMDERCRPSGVPPMIYTWTIQEIQRSTTPTIRVEHGHPLYVGPDEGPRHAADPARESWDTVSGTRIWDDAYYRLRCRLHSAEAIDTMAASGRSSPYGPLPTS